eukprot:TRINITY_DN774158_c0_g1_i1.p1 TRINITY_DN774158_c0_g1~~TRINITY_DN774158_c0_g1_i1.p1  ORF type:complete len:819 (+),score=288.55 TRINITY_DN774158_c0_g1_i1:25-2457(+)
MSKRAPKEFIETPRRLRTFVSNKGEPIPGEKNTLITSALPYSNNVPHLGNLIGCVLSADVYARFCRLRGDNVMYICGTDEYGTATETKALAEGCTPRELCDKFHKLHDGIYQWFDISFDIFGRTSCADPKHDTEWAQTRIAQQIFRDNMENGNLCEQIVEQVYCLECKKFLADRFIEGTCPHCGYEDARGDQCDGCGKLLSATELISPRCKTDAAHPVEIRQSEHLFLDLPKIKDDLEAWIRKSSDEGKWTSNSIQITDGWIRDGLKARCITRDLKWGTPVPHEKFSDKVFYVWFDAPIGYISITANGTEHWEQWWQNPENVKLYQFMGKDNIPFHTVIFPATLLGSGKDWTMLHHVSTTEYLNYENTKFSKSRNIGVFGDQAKETGIPSEAWRYYLLINRPEQSDTFFMWSDFADKINNELLKNLGNFCNRGLTFAYKFFEGKTPECGEPTERELKLKEEADALIKTYFEQMDQVKIKAALKTVMALSSLGNGYMQDTKPWVLAKSDLAHCATVVAHVMSLVRLIAGFMEPFMPGFTDKVLHQLNLDHYEFLPAEFSVHIEAGHSINEPAPLFKQLTPAEIKGFRLKFGGEEARLAIEEEEKALAKTKKGGKVGRNKNKQKKGQAPKPKRVTVDRPGVDNLARINIVVGEIKKAWRHETADRLICEEIDLGEALGGCRNIVSGVAEFYAPEDMVGKKVLVMANLDPRKLKGFMSNGMVLCASNDEHTQLEFVEPPAGASIGDRVIVAGINDVAEPDTVVYGDKKSPLPSVIAALQTVDGIVCYGPDKDKAFKIGDEFCTAPSLLNNTVG